MLTLAEYSRYDGLGLAELVRRGAISAQELTTVAQQAMAAVDPRLGLIVDDMREHAAATLARPLPDGPFRGVPLLLKDFVINYAGVATRFGSRLFEGLVPDHDNEMMARFRRAGFVTLGKTSCPEFGFSATAEALVYGRAARNPWDPARTTSGSSGGSAAAVAARVVPVAYGDDGGGSIRLPASHNGVFGLKPSRGRVPLGPDIPDSAFAGLACCHALTRSVRDSAAVLDALAGADPGATYTAPPPARPFLDETREPPGRLRIAWTSTLSNDVTVHADCQAAVEDAAKLCASLGHDVRHVKLELDRAALSRAWCTAIIGWLQPVVDGTAAMLGRTPGPENLEAVTWSAVRHGREQKTAEIVGAQMLFNALSRRFAEFFGDYDILLTPTVSQPPPPLGAVNQNDPAIDAYDFTDRFLMRIGHTCAFFNATGQPAMSVPLFWNHEGLPIGSHFVARYGDEATLLRLAAQLEQERPWEARRPPICVG